REKLGMPTRPSSRSIVRTLAALSSLTTLLPFRRSSDLGQRKIGDRSGDIDVTRRERPKIDQVLHTDNDRTGAGFLYFDTVGSAAQPLDDERSQFTELLI